MGVVIQQRRVSQTVLLQPTVIVPNGVPLLRGQAVAIRQVGDHQEYVPCGALLGDFADLFYGFLPEDGVPGEVAPVVTGRGSVVSPLVEVGQSLTPECPVFLSVVPGCVTPVPPQGVPEAKVLRVGTALTSSSMFLVTDDYYWVS